MSTADKESHEVPLRFGYNTNGFAHHALEDALRIIADLGYEGVALALDVHHLNPFTTAQSEIRSLKRLLNRLRLDVVIETGARYLLDPLHKHEPSFVNASGNRKRMEFTKRAIDIAQSLGAPVVTVHSGTLPPGESPDAAQKRLVSGLKTVCEHALAQGVTVGLEPEPDMFVQTVADYRRVRDEVAHPALKLTLDVGHLVCAGHDTPGEIIAHLGGEIANAHIEDIKNREHHHLPPGEGDIDFGPILAAFRAIGYAGLINVELSRNSHNAPVVAREAIKYFRSIIQDS